MVVTDNMLREIAMDIEAGITVMSQMLQEYPIEYAYLKGSAIKPINHPIDYVPILSDLDIHVRFEESFPQMIEGIEKGLKFSKSYEEWFFEQRPQALHLPRVSIKDLSDLENIEAYTPSPRSQMKIIIGDLPSSYKSLDESDPDLVARNNRLQLLEAGEFLRSFGFKLLDRSDLDWWIMLRHISWRVSPSPYRLVALKTGDNTVWELTRSELLQKIEELGLEELKFAYEKYYLMGWELFNDNFSNSDLFRDIIFEGTQVMYLCYSEVKEMEIP